MSSGAHLSDATRLAYGRDVERWLAWLRIEQREPPTAVDVLQWVAARIADGAAPSTLRRSIAALRALPELSRVELDGAGFARALRSALRKGRRTPKGARPIYPDTLQQMIDLLGLRTDEAADHDRALLLVGWWGALRRSELVRLEWSDVEWDGADVRLTVRRGKTDPEGRSMMLLAGSQLSAVEALERLDRFAGPIFDVSERYVSRLVNRLAGAGYSAHSLRAGWISTAGALGVPEYAIQAHSGHRDARSMRGYIREANIKQATGSRAISAAINAASHATGAADHPLALLRRR